MWGPVLKTLHYAFSVNRPTRDDTAQRSGFMQFQTYPENQVWGMAQPREQYFHAYQPPQVMTHNKQVVAGVFAGGSPAGTVVMQPLIDTSKASG